MAKEEAEIKKKNDNGKNNKNIKTTEKTEPVEKPDEKEYTENVERETKAIDELRAKINDLQQKINSVAGGKEEYNRKRGEIKSRLDELQQQIDSLENQKKTLSSSIESKKKEGLEAKQNVEKMKKSIGFSTAEEIDKKIEMLENNLITNTLDLKEEKEILQQIKRLKISKPIMGKIATIEQSSITPDTSIGPLRQNLESAREKLIELRTTKRGVNEKYRELIEQRQHATAPVRELIEERDQLSKHIADHYAQRKAYHDEYREALWKYNQYKAKVIAEKNEKIREERQKRQADQERINLQKELEKAEATPLEGEVSLLSQVIQYVEKLIHDNDQTKPSQNHVNTEKREIPKGDGVTLLPKDQREEEYFYAPVAKKKSEKKHHKKEKSKIITHDIGTLSYFEQCGVAAPVSVDELQPCLDKLERSLEERKQLQDARAAEIEDRRRQIQAQLDALDAQE